MSRFFLGENTTYAARSAGYVPASIQSNQSCYRDHLYPPNAVRVDSFSQKQVGHIKRLKNYKNAGRWITFLLRGFLRHEIATVKARGDVAPCRPPVGGQPSCCAAKLEVLLASVTLPRKAVAAVQVEAVRGTRCSPGRRRARGRGCVAPLELAMRTSTRAPEGDAGEASAHGRISDHAMSG